MPRHLALVVSAWAVLVALGVCARVDAAAITPGDLLIYRVGNGEALANTGNVVFIDEYTRAGALVQSIPMPTVGNGIQQALYSPGNSSSEGLITRSGDGNYIMITGYAGTSVGAITATTGATLARVIGRLDGNGNLDTSTTLTDSAITTNFRSAVSSNGTDIWATGGATAGTGIRYTTFGTQGSGTNISTTTGGDWRQVNIYNNQLYLSANVTANRFNSVGTGLPTAAGSSALTAFPGVATAGYQFFLADLDGSPGLDTLYYAEDAAGAGIRKYSLVAGTWVLNGTISVNPLSTTAGNNLRGLVGEVSGANVNLFATLGATSGTGTGNLYGVIDSAGYNTAPSTALAASLASVTGGGSFRGIALAPIPEPAGAAFVILSCGILRRARRISR